MDVSLSEARDAFEAAAGRFDTMLTALTDEQLLARTRCRGWVVSDVVAHLHLGLSEMITGFAYRVEGPPDTDAATYWQRSSAPDPDADIAQIRFARLLSSAYGRPSGLVRHVRPTLAALRRFVADADEGCVLFQGHTLTMGNFVATWVVEIALHHLDVLPELPGMPEPPLALVVRTLDGLRGTSDRPDGWDDVTYALIGAGRVPADLPGFPLLG